MASFDWQYIYNAAPELLSGMMMTFKVSIISIVLAFALGFGGVLMRLSPIVFLRGPAQFYVSFIRNTPILVQLLFIYYGLPNIGVRLSEFWSGVLCLTLWGTSYHIESLRAGYLSVSRGIGEAADALGLKHWHFNIFIAFPIALRTALPSMTNTSIAMLKNSSYIQAIGLAELTYIAIDKVSFEFRTIEMFSAICVFYLVLVFILSFAAKKIESYFNRPFLVR